RVQPALGETLAVSAMLIHPVIGGAAWLVQKVLRDPVDQVFAFEYSVTGKWADPQVVKLNANRDINKEIEKDLAEKAKAGEIKP
ncbi:MAG TPA: AsmA-like C-terminal region-containing protein, partial [Rhodocyclaceae bacterium]|nr:AsmA-like C-terminal region-containing protein [Rhodocyclaceae bacterium]